MFKLIWNLIWFLFVGKRLCNHEWERWSRYTTWRGIWPNSNKPVQTRTCKKCGKIQTRIVCHTHKEN